MELTLKQITKKFGRKRAVDRMDITLSHGVYGLLGANGAGKTTLMRMICGVLNPSEGEILLDGHNIREYGDNYRSLLGYLPQDFGYYPDFTAKEFMHYIAALKGLSDKKARHLTKELLEIVSLSDVADKKIRTFSGGMKQRLGIAQAVINNPKILVLDEPTAGLDPKERVRFRNLIADFSKDKIVILSTHIVSDVEYIADTILMMKSGKLLLRGTVERVTDSMLGKVWKYVADERGASRISELFCVANLHHLEDGNIEVRVISDDRPFAEAVPMQPTLEDLYLY
ncbi:MAG: ABC transporter ATP-binding protein, partial [Lachnospiraceae bacterium]|nr:ABC transporter ATP-binding protein [Lachnospiraceae bacterium]